MGIDGLGTKSVVGAHLPAGQALVADLDHVGYQVNRENVLGVYSVLANEAERLSKVMQDNGHKLEVGLCGGDPVSYDAQHGFSAKLDRLRTQCNDYVYSLAKAAERVRQAARAYGYSEDQITAAFRTAAHEGSPPNRSPQLKQPPQAGPPASSPYAQLPRTGVGHI